MDEQENSVVESLKTRNGSEEDLVSSIDCASVLLSLASLNPLYDILLDPALSANVREQAAIAIRTIGPQHLANELNALHKAQSQELRKLAEIALGLNASR